MGQMTHREIAEWQQRAGLVPTTGGRAEKLNHLQQLAFELIRVCELERSGIRDGDGWWHGSDPLSGLLDDIGRLFAELKAEDSPAANDSSPWCEEDLPF